MSLQAIVRIVCGIAWLIALLLGLRIIRTEHFNGYLNGQPVSYHGPAAQRWGWFLVIASTLIEIALQLVVAPFF